MTYPRSALTLAVLAAGCAGQEAPNTRAASTVQEQACVAAVAAHVGRPADEVLIEGTESAGNGAAVVTLRDGSRIHTCGVDAAGTVRAIRHPGR